MALIQHIENHLGPVFKGWKDNRSEGNFQIVSFRNCPAENLSTFISLGMSDHILKINDSKEVRQELVFSIHTISISNMVVSFLMSLCESILVRGMAVLRGEVIPLASEMAQRIGFDYLYCTIPVLFDDEFCYYEKTSPSTVMVWIIPISESEASYIKENGWESFEDLLEEEDPDLCSLERNSIV